MRVRATCFGDRHVSRLDATTLRVRPERRFLDNELLRVVRGLSRPFRPGDEIVLSNLHLRVREASPDARPAEADLALALPLEDASLLWTRLHAGRALAPWAPPAVGESQVWPSLEAQ
jgi:hypothetical protein